MLNKKHFNSILKKLKVPRNCDFVFVDFFVTADKHYPGIKIITIEAINQNIWFKIHYDDIMKIFNCDNKPLKMKMISKYLMANGNQLDYRALDFAEGLRNRSNDFFAHRDCKNIRITVDTYKLEESLFSMLELIERKAEENQFIIQHLSDLY